MTYISKLPSLSVGLEGYLGAVKGPCRNPIKASVVGEAGLVAAARVKGVRNAQVL